MQATQAYSRDTVQAPSELFKPSMSLDITTRFELGSEITEEQQAFLHEYGFLVFKGVVKQTELDTVLSEVDNIEQQWLSENRDNVYGIPLFKGIDDRGQPFIQRFPFTSQFSDYIRKLVRDDRFLPVRSLVGDNTRVGDEEKDGVVLNRYINVPGSVYPRLGWHTDGLRDLAYLRMPKQMLNVGLHFDHIPKQDGGLRLIPGTHRQSFARMCFHKAYFVSHKPDPNEIAVETEPGDLTVHDGRLWHRVQQSPHYGRRSLRRSMYLPYLTDEHQPKSENSKTPFYHHLGKGLRKLRVLSATRRARRK